MLTKLMSQMVLHVHSEPHPHNRRRALAPNILECLDRSFYRSGHLRSYWLDPIAPRHPGDAVAFVRIFCRL